MTDLQELTQETNRIVTASFDVLLQFSRPLNARMYGLPCAKCCIVLDAWQS